MYHNTGKTSVLECTWVYSPIVAITLCRVFSQSEHKCISLSHIELGIPQHLYIYHSTADSQCLVSHLPQWVFLSSWGKAQLRPSLCWFYLFLLWVFSNDKSVLKGWKLLMVVFNWNSQCKHSKTVQSNIRKVTPMLLLTVQNRIKLIVVK